MKSFETLRYSLGKTVEPHSDHGILVESGGPDYDSIVWISRQRVDGEWEHPLPSLFTAHSQVHCFPDIIDYNTEY